MDSKLRRTAILSSMALILLVSLFVVFSNLPQPGPGREDNTPAQTTPLPEQEGQT